jgi:parvulin-like peptidyl-prolyl isomerase
MRIILKLIVPALVVAAIIGCAGGKSGVSVTQEAAGGDSSKVFVFARSPLLSINSDMIAERLHSARIPGQRDVIDSARVLNVVYDILLDSLLGRDADAFDLRKENPTLYRQYMQLRFDKVMGMMYKEVIVDSISIDSAAVSASYDEQKEDFHVPNQYRARHIVIAGEGFRQSPDSMAFKDLTNEQLDSLAYAKLADIRQRIMNGENFDTLAILYSQDANSAKRGGDLGYFELAQMVQPFDSTIEHTPIGEISPIIKTQYGWHIVKVEEYAPEHYQPLDSVYAVVENKLKEKAAMERSRVFVDSLRSAATIVYDTAVLRSDDSLLNNDLPVAYVNPTDKRYGNDTLYFRDLRENEYAYRKFKKIEGPLGFDDKVEILSTVAIRPILLEASRKLGYYNRPVIEDWAKFTIKKYSISDLRKRLTIENYEPTEEELRAYYNSHIDEYVEERPLTVQHIVFADSALAELVRDQLLSGVDFMEMVDKYYPGDPDIRRAAADLGEIGPDDMPTEFYQAAMKTAINDISYPVKTKYGYHIIKVLKKTHSLEFENAKVQIKPILLRTHKEQSLRTYVDSRLGGSPKIYWDRLSDLYFQPVPPPDFSSFMRTAP